MKYNIKIKRNKFFSILYMRKFYTLLKRIRQESDFNFNDDVLLFHKKNITDYKGEVSLELGAGASLFYNIALSDILKIQYLYDISLLIDKNSVNKVLKLLGKESIRTIDDLKKEGIYYHAPMDILEVDSFPYRRPNFFQSSSTFEHIPRESLVLILNHLAKILEKGSYMSLHIDYSDHLSHSDPSCSRNHFLTFSDDDFKKINSWVCYQNRLRHMHYKEIFQQAGYSIVSEEYLNYDEPPRFINKGLLTGHESDFFTTGRWVLRSP